MYLYRPSTGRQPTRKPNEGMQDPHHAVSGEFVEARSVVAYISSFGVTSRMTELLEK